MLALTATAPRILPCPVPLFRAKDLAHPGRDVASGQLIRVRRGIYTPAASWRVVRPWNRYLARVYAVAMVAPHAVFSHESAAALWGMPVIGDPVIVHTVVGADCAAREVAGIRSHRAETLPRVISAGGMLITDPATVAVSLARHRHNAFGLAAADAALRIDPATSLEELWQDNETRNSSRGRQHARWPLERATPRRASVLESVGAATVEWMGYPTPEFQHTFRTAGGIEYRGDMWWPECGLLGEPDGEFKYDGRFGDPAALLRARHQRDRALLDGEPRAIAHWGWIDVVRVRPLRSLLDGHGLTQIRPENSGQLASLTTLLSPYERLLRPR